MIDKVKLLKLLFLGTILISCSTNNYAPLPVTDNVDVKKYIGKWYEIAHLPFKQQEGCTCTTAEYEIIDSTTLRVINRCRKNDETEEASGKAFVVEGTNNTKLRVQFFWPFRGDYWIVFLDQENYNWAIVGTPSRKYLWILSRTPQMEKQLTDNLITKIKQVGFNTDKLIFTEQNCN